MLQLSRQKIGRQILSRRLFLKQKKFRLIWTDPVQIPSQNLCPPRCILYLQAKSAGYTLRNVSSLWTNVPVKIVNYGKNLVPDFNSFAYRKGKNKEKQKLEKKQK